ncbi:unnamed protein product [Brachionus calyciflorus]|uniref:Basal body-orientation factor 1 n=1 Tax=Brachionus calyciflorus TaxID=104777 RepID=A0A813VPN1_9BILA|nr:unnamed protein product [Brachionus calyciflorus]
MAEIENLKKINQNLLIENDKLNGQNADMTFLIKEKIDTNTKQSKQIKELQAKIEVLEKSLSQVIREFETERESLIHKCKLEMESGSIELEKMKRALELKNKEMNKVKKLAKNILEQRSDIERFFLDSLDYVKKQVSINRNEYRKEANQMYNNRMLAAYNGQMEYPKVKTFSKKFDANSTNNVFNDLEQAVKWQGVDKVFDLNDLTWEQKEQVLRELFARMNGVKPKQVKNGNDELKAVELDETINDADSNEDDNDIKYLDRRDVKKSFNNNSETNFTFLTEPNYQAPSKPNEMLKLPSIVS